MIRLLLTLTVVATGSVPQSGPGAPAPEWRAKGAPRLSWMGDAQFLRQGVPYVEESYFVDLRGLRQQAGAASSALGLQAAMLSGKVWLGCRLRILVAISAAKRRAFLTENLRIHWPGKDFPSERADVQEFLDFNGRLLNEQDTYDYLFAPSGALHIRYAGGPTRTFTSPELVGAFRRVEFSDDPENPGLLAAMILKLAKRP